MDIHKINEWRIAWVVTFIAADLNKPREGDVLNLREDLHAFLLFPPRNTSNEVLKLAEPFHAITIKDAGIWDNCDLSILRDLQNTCRDILGSVAKPNPNPVNPKSWPLDLSFGVSKNGQPLIEGKSVDLFLFTLFNALAVEGRDRILICPNCKRIFLKMKRQKYCSRRCGMAQFMREYRKTEQGRDKTAKANAIQYEKQTKKKTGPNVKVHPRTTKKG
jgi:hypothetical protein